MTVTLHVRTGRLDPGESLEAAIAGLAPEVSWVEPAIHLPEDGRAGRRRDFRAIRRGGPAIGDLPVAELRLSWTEGLLHLVAVEDGIRWVALETAEGAIGFERPGAEQLPPADYVEVSRKVLWRGDLDRFLGDDRGDPAREATVLALRARAFRKGPAVRAWWLVPVETAGGVDDG